MPLPKGSGRSWARAIARRTDHRADLQQYGSTLPGQQTLMYSLVK